MLKSANHCLSLQWVHQIAVITDHYNKYNNKKIEILLELPKCDTDMQWTNAVGKIMMIDLTQCCYKASICKKKKQTKNPTTSGKHKEGMPVWLIQLTT